MTVAKKGTNATNNKTSSPSKSKDNDNKSVSKQKRTRKGSESSIASIQEDSFLSLVKKYVSIANGKKPNIDNIVHCMRALNQKYQCKDVEYLRRKVKRAVKRINAEQKQGQQNQQNQQQQQQQQEQLQQQFQEQLQKQLQAQQLQASMQAQAQLQGKVLAQRTPGDGEQQFQSQHQQQQRRKEELEQQLLEQKRLQLQLQIQQQQQQQKHYQWQLEQEQQKQLQLGIEQKFPLSSKFHQQFNTQQQQQPQMHQIHAAIAAAVGQAAAQNATSTGLSIPGSSPLNAQILSAISGSIDGSVYSANNAPIMASASPNNSVESSSNNKRTLNDSLRSKTDGLQQIAEKIKQMNNETCKTSPLKNNDNNVHSLSKKDSNNISKRQKLVSAPTLHDSTTKSIDASTESPALPLSLEERLDSSHASKKVQSVMVDCCAPMEDSDDDFSDSICDKSSNKSKKIFNTPNNVETTDTKNKTNLLQIQEKISAAALALKGDSIKNEDGMVLTSSIGIMQQEQTQNYLKGDIKREDIANLEKESDKLDNSKISSSSGTFATAGTKSGSRRSRKKSSSKRIGQPAGANSGKHGDFPNDEGPSSDVTTPVPRPKERYCDLGGISDIIEKIKEFVEYPTKYSQLYAHLGVDPPRGILLRGPPGTGKSHLADAIAGEMNFTYYRVSAPELVSNMSGQSESRIRDLFMAAKQNAPSIIFLDELDVIASKRNNDNQRGMERRIVAQLLTSMDLLNSKNDATVADTTTTKAISTTSNHHKPVIVLAATNRADSMDPALRRAGRFDKEISLGIPDEDARIHMLRTMTSKMRISSVFDYKSIARQTPGYVGADLISLTKEAATIAVKRIFTENKEFLSKSTTDQNDASKSSSTTASSNPLACAVLLTQEEMDPLYLTMDDFIKALKRVQPSGQREGFSVVADVNWDNIGALSGIREELAISVLEPIRNPEKFKALGIPLPAGVLLYGPPGCGKTLVAKAIANESGANFISVKGPELLDKYVGESERAVRRVFERARSSSPCVVFFDELDSLCPKRGGDSGGGVTERVVNQLLTEMDGLESRRSVFVIAATNRPELIDPAMMRPGRLDKLLYVPLPTPDDRVSILQALAVKVKLHAEVDLDFIGRSSHASGYSGADCAALLRESGLAVLREEMHKEKQQKEKNTESNDCKNDNTESICIRMRHFESAFHKVVPSISKADQRRYDKLRSKLFRSRSRGDTNTKNDASNNLALDHSSIADSENKIPLSENTIMEDKSNDNLDVTDSTKSDLIASKALTKPQGRHGPSTSNLPPNVEPSGGMEDKQSTEPGNGMNVVE